MMTAREAAEYHREQIDVFRSTDADFVSAFTINYVAEAIGVAQAATAAAMPSVISFTVETDGRLPTGQALADAIKETDAATDNAPAYYMINCAHPTHFRRCARQGRSLDAAAARPARQRLGAQPRRTRCRGGPRRRRSHVARPAIPRAAGPVAAVHRAGRLLRHRLSPCRADLLRLHGDGLKRRATRHCARRGEDLCRSSRPAQWGLCGNWRLLAGNADRIVEVYLDLGLALEWVDCAPDDLSASSSVDFRLITLRLAACAPGGAALVPRTKSSSRRYRSAAGRLTRGRRDNTRPNPCPEHHRRCGVSSHR